MQWFKHKVNGHNGERLKHLAEEIGYHKAYACYFTLMELCADQYDGSTTIFKLRSKVLREAMRLRGNNLLVVMLLMSSCSLTNAQQDLVDKDLWIISWPEIAEIKDEYHAKKTRMSGQDPDSVRYKRVRVNKEEGEIGDETKSEPLSSTKKFDLQFDKNFQTFEEFVIEHAGMTPRFKTKIPDVYLKWKDHPDDFNAFIQTKKRDAESKSKNPEQVKAYVRTALLGESGVA